MDKGFRNMCKEKTCGSCVEFYGTTNTFCGHPMNIVNNPDTLITHMRVAEHTPCCGFFTNKATYIPSLKKC